MERLREQLAVVVNNLERAAEMGSPIWPLNEADTERLVIEPVLRALGYGELDYRKRMQAVGANFPDYLVLPASDQRWVLEAKEWDARLEERFERQAVNYANNNGAQWAVLTNGRVWWIYNTRATGDLSQQRIYTVENLFDLDDATRVLPYLSRASIQGGELDRAYRAGEIKAALIAELRTGNRQITNAIRSVVGRALDRNVSSEDISEAVKDILCETSSASLPEVQPQRVTREDDNESYTLEALSTDSELCTGRMPCDLVLNGGTRQNVQSWRDVACQAMQGIDLVRTISLPVKTRKGNRYFLAAESIHEDGVPMKASREITIGGTIAFVDLHRSARDLMKSTAQVMRMAGADPASVVVTLAATEA